jgi:phosphatidylserine decarboxylase
MTKEGIIFPLPFFVAAIIMFYLFQLGMNMTFLYISAGVFYIGLLLMLFFRDPDRKVPPGKDLIISPADGRVIRIENEGANPAISIFLGIHNVHVNRAPVTGVIKSVVHHPGKFHAAFRDEAMTENERNEIEIETEYGAVWMRQVAGALARRTIFYEEPGDRVQAGQRVGLIRFGSRVDLVFPSGVNLRVTLKQKVRAGESILGQLR